MTVAKFFNTAGPMIPEDHYYIPVSQRIDLDAILTLIEQKRYFVLHAPRQSGKTTAILEICRILNSSGRYHCLYVNVESAQMARENIAEAMRIIIQEMVQREGTILPQAVILAKHAETVLQRSPTSALGLLLNIWASESRLPTVLLIDEIDALVGDSLVSVLRQLRAGYDNRPKHFPQSVILCGVRDVRDDRIHVSAGKDPVTGGSCFNINAESLRIGSFNAEEVRALYQQHTAATGQVFTEEALQLAFDLTRGQPWLVNALAYQACFKDPVGKDRKRPVTAELIQTAKEALIQARATHLDQLADKLKELRVRAVIAPLLEGIVPAQMQQEDIEYVTDLGLVVKTSATGLAIANPIYREVIPRQLTYVTQTLMDSVIPRQWYIADDGSIAVDKLLTDFQQFFRENSESWIERFDYREAGPQLLLQAYLQRVVNGGGRIDREYGLGRGRTDLLLTWFYGGAMGESLHVQKAVFELKIQHGSRKKTLDEGIVQTTGYLERVGLKHGHLLIFDRSPKKAWSKKIFRREITAGEYRISVWGM